MDSEEQRSALRAAVYLGDGRAVVELLRGVGADDRSLQLAGDGLIAAVMQRVDGAAELAREFVVGLRQRGGRGMMSWRTSLRLSSAFSEERQRGRARSWLAAAGYRVRPVDRRDS